MSAKNERQPHGMNSGYCASVQELLGGDTDNIVGVLSRFVAETGFDIHNQQIKVWVNQVNLLKDSLRRLSCDRRKNCDGWYIALEYELPRRQKRPDTILLAGDRILVIEFKFGAGTYNVSAQWQAENYAFNLRDFHAGSHKRCIVPILCAVDAPNNTQAIPFCDGSLVAPVHLANQLTLSDVIRQSCEFPLPSIAIDTPIEAKKWLSSPYRPSLTIVEAAEKLYSNHSVREISHSYAANLDSTTDMLADAILDAKRHKKRCVCFITGVPGAGKTLTGLNVVHDPDIRSKQGPSGIFLSGNGPLVTVVREALIISQQRTGRKRNEAEHEVSTFIQNVHYFLRYHRENPAAVPHEHVVVFDEAQRAWGREQMQRKQGVNNSEAAELLSVMERTGEWSVIVALVGGGQEIFTGEAGLEEWGKAIAEASEQWAVVASPEVVRGGESVAGHRLFADAPPKSVEIRYEPLAHLSVSVRSYRAQQITQWVNDLLELETESAQASFPDVREFPFFVTRNLNHARTWLRARSGSDPMNRCGLVATSKDQRFRAYGLENSSSFLRGYPFEKWYLSPPEKIRSSFALEVAATEFECQGLELDWVGVCWGGDLTPKANEKQWDYREFRGDSWRNCRSDIKKAYTRNRYRVLLTRARSGMVIWVPPGSTDDLTRDSARFDRIYELLKSAGISDLAMGGI